MDDLDSDAMAKAMGFASFGAQNPSKRRKFNHAADAVVAAPDLSLPSHKPPPGSASNAVPLGICSRTQNTDEIDLDDDEEEQEGNATTEAATAQSTVQSDATRPGAQDNSAAASQVDAPVSMDQGHRQGGRPGRGGFGGRGRDANAIWWTDYYDPSANVNPWERLEQERGLQARGPWMTWDEAKSKA